MRDPRFRLVSFNAAVTVISLIVLVCAIGIYGWMLVWW